MNAIYNLILDSEGLKPITKQNLKSVNGLCWFNWVKVDKWVNPKTGKTVSQKEAIENIKCQQ